MALAILSGASLAVVWQKIRYEGVALRYTGLARENDRLNSGLENGLFAFQKNAARSTLVPRAIKIGLVDVRPSDIVLVSMEGIDTSPPNELFTGIMGEAQAADKNSTLDRQLVHPSPGARDGR